MKKEPENVQKAEDGYGPLYHRMYSVEFEASWEDCVQAMARLQQDVNCCSPQAIATFVKTKGEAHVLANLDEFDVRLSAPANAPVSVKGVSKHAFTLITLTGHIEAGEIRFSIKHAGKDKVRFEIESLARSRNGIVDFFYDKIPVARLAQGIMWVEFCRNFIRLSVGDKIADQAEVSVLTEKQAEEGGEWQKV